MTFNFHFIAQTENGTVTNQTWFNDDETQESKLVHAGHVSEIIGDGDETEYDSLDDLNAELYGMSFTETPQFK